MITAKTTSHMHAQPADDRDWLLTAGGAALLFLALSKRSTIGLTALLGGGYLLYRSLPKESLGGLLPKSLPAVGSSRSPAASTHRPPEWSPVDAVEEASMESFPASDPPATY